MFKKANESLLKIIYEINDYFMFKCFHFFYQRTRKTKVTVGIRSPYIRVVGIEVDQEGLGRTSTAHHITPQEEEEFRRLSANPNVYQIIAKSIAPSIYGSIGKFLLEL